MKRKVIRDHTKVVLELAIFEKVAPLPPIRSGGVLENDRYSGARFLEVNAKFDAIERQVDVAPDRGLETCRGLPPSGCTPAISKKRLSAG